MHDWGSIPDWINVLFALLALIAFFIVEREKLFVKRRESNNKSESSDLENKQVSLSEASVGIRAEMYSRILIGVIFGVSLAPIFSWISSNFYAHNDYNFELRNIAELTIAASFSIILSVLLTFIFHRSYPKWNSIFVHWVERLAISYLGFCLILFVFSAWLQNPETGIYYIKSYTFINSIISVLLFLLISFSSTPVDWIIYLVVKSKEGKP